ncbi:hypothetical protein EIP86_007173 [Pleurotus ostreatoroseus]|nr:hypothetical protein EIP86_007173 [Pleurotus ostreatoroseus]
MGTAADVYAQELGIKNYGLPLWFPEPVDGHGEVRIGDVGFIHEGQFHRLFNATVGQDHPYNRHGVPTDFSPLNFQPQLLNIRHDYLEPGPISSKSVKSYHIGGSASAQGAILVLKDSAKKTYVLPSRNFTTYMGKHHMSWYEFASLEKYGLLLRPENIVLVRGTIKTTAWALGAYIDSGNDDHGVSFTAQAGQVAGAELEWSFSKQISSHFEHRSGPRRRTEAMFSPRHTISDKGGCHELELPEILAERQQAADIAVGRGNSADQCVFLSCYKVKYRLGFLKKVIAAAGPPDLPEDREQSPGVWVNSQSDSISMDPPEPPKYRTPVDDILEYILDTTNANVAIASDDDVAEILQEMDLPPDFPAYLRGSNLSVSVDEYGTGTLCPKTSIGTLVHDVPTDSHERLTSTVHPTDHDTQDAKMDDRRLSNSPSVLDTDVRMTDGDDDFSETATPVSRTSTLVSFLDDKKLKRRSRSTSVPIRYSTTEPLARALGRGGCWTCRLRHKVRSVLIVNKDKMALYKADLKQQLAHTSLVREPSQATTDSLMSDETIVDLRGTPGRDISSGASSSVAGWRPSMVTLRESMERDYDTLTTELSPPGSPSLPVAVQVDVLQEYVLYYFQYVRPLHFVFAGNTLAQTLYDIISSESDGVVVHAICTIAALHAAKAAYDPGNSLHPSERPLHIQFYDLAHNLLLRSSQSQYFETDAIAAIYLIAYKRLLGSGSNWHSFLEIALGWLDQTGISAGPNPELQLCDMTPRQRLAAKTTMWADLMSSVVFVHPPRFLGVYRQLLGYWEAGDEDLWAMTRSTQPCLHMENLMGCPDDVFLALAEIASLANWKKNEVAQGTLSILELVRRYEIIEKNLNQLHQGSGRGDAESSVNPIGLFSAIPTAASIPDPSDAQRQGVAKIYRETAMLYLRTILNGSYPGVTEISESVNIIVTTIQSLRFGDFDRGLLFPIVLTGCMAPTPVFDDMLRSRCSVHNDESIVSVFVQALNIIRRMRAQPGRDIDWRDVVRETSSSLFVV